MPGPKPKPTGLKLVQGNPGHQKLPQNEPKPRPILPDPPTFLNKAARNIWNELLPELEYMGTLTAADQATFAGFCRAYELAQRTSRYLDRNGLTMTAPSGYSQARPEVSICNKAWDAVAKFGAELGIGAASRSRIEVRKRDDEVEDPTAKAIAVAARRK